MFVYLLLCRDGSIYTGTARDLQKRMRDHFEGTRAAAAYTRSHGAAYLLAAWECDTLSAALRAEAAIKRLPRAKKEALATAPSTLSTALFPTLEGAAFTPLRQDDPRLLSVRERYRQG